MHCTCGAWLFFSSYFTLALHYTRGVCRYGKVAAVSWFLPPVCYVTVACCYGDVVSFVDMTKMFYPQTQLLKHTSGLCLLGIQFLPLYDLLWEFQSISSRKMYHILGYKVFSIGISPILYKLGQHQ